MAIGSWTISPAHVDPEWQTLMARDRPELAFLPVKSLNRGAIYQCVSSAPVESFVVTGQAGRNVEINDDEMGFVASGDQNPQKARITVSFDSRLLLTQSRKFQHSY